MIAQSMMIKVNKSEYVTIACPLPQGLGTDVKNRLTAPLVNILYFQCTGSHLAQSDHNIVVG
nr:MAG TPA: hypothetical protein [Caudoviricetes sp.]